MLPSSGRAPVVAVIGATGLAGAMVLQILEERNFLVDDLRPMASVRSAGKRVVFHGVDMVVSEVDEAQLVGVDVAFFAAGAATSRRFAPIVAADGGVAVDKSSAFRMDPAVPLIVPEVNGDLVGSHRGIIANPNCVAIPLTVVLAPLHRAFGLQQITVATYQSASGGGRHLADELMEQTRADAAGELPRHRVYPHVLHGNVVPGGWKMVGEDTEEEVKIIEETRRILGAAELPMSVTTVRVPVSVGHSAAVWIQFDGPVEARPVREVLAQATGVRVVDDPARQQYPTSRDAAGGDDVLVGRVRRDAGRRGGVVLFLSADNLRKGAATNAVQVAELALRDVLRSSRATCGLQSGAR